MQNLLTSLGNKALVRELRLRVASGLLCTKDMVVFQGSIEPPVLDLRGAMV